MTIRIAASKKEKIFIRNIEEFNTLLINEIERKERIDLNDKKIFVKTISEIFNIKENISERIYSSINDEKTEYRANDIYDFINYIEKIIEFENIHKDLCKKIEQIQKIYIDRTEYERIQSTQDDVSHLLEDIEKIKKESESGLNNNEKGILERIQSDIEENYCYAKDIELLKRIICNKNNEIEENYDEIDKVKRIIIKVPRKISSDYIKPCKGSIEYHYHISQNIPRINRIIKNIDKYIQNINKDINDVVRINQSKALQDSINIAIAVFDGKEFKAVSGSNDVFDYCRAPKEMEAVFESHKVNKLGKFGTGYKRVNDSEKKIFEEIHKQIELKNIKDEGNLFMYSKYEPCPSCYYVISQFSKSHPKIKISIKYEKKYGAM